MCTYTPPPGGRGIDSFEYTITDDRGGYHKATVTIDISPNAPPVAFDDSVSTVETRNGWVGVVGNDQDLDGDPLRVIAKTDGTHGTVQCRVGPPSTPPYAWCSYTLDVDYTGPFPLSDSFTYTMTDGKGPTHVDTATVSVTVFGNRLPSALGDVASTFAGRTLRLTPLLNDSDPDDDLLAIVAETGATATCTDDECFYVAPPAPGGSYPFQDSFTYTISDGHGHEATATISISVGADGPPTAVDDVATARAGRATRIAVLANDTDPAGDVLTITGFTPPAHGTVECPAINFADSCTYRADPSFVGPDSFTYTVEDDEGDDVATVAIDVRPANEAVVANDDQSTCTASARM